MRVLCFDISTGGLGRAVFDEDLAAHDAAESSWEIAMEESGAAVLTVDTLDAALRKVMERTLSAPVDAIAFSGFMHSSLLLDRQNRPLTPIFTWMDRRGSEAVERLRTRFGSEFHERTGCRFHPMFPVFKVASFRMPGMRRVVSAKSFLIGRLTGAWIEDHGTASATGLYNTRNQAWDEGILEAISLEASALLPLVERESSVGTTQSEARAYGLDSGIPVVAGSGDGFLANLGSGCEEPQRMAITLGTSSSARQVLPDAILNEAAGTFCYRANPGAYLLGCASNNGGNVLDWARAIFGSLPSSIIKGNDCPVFLPLLHGERSPEWDPTLRGSWYGLNAHHTAADLAASVVDGVVFNLAHYAEIIERASAVRPKQFLLSGNGFLNEAACQTLAALLDGEVLRPRNQGLASLRGAAVCALRALGVNPVPQLERLVDDSERIQSFDEPHVMDRYRVYRKLRAAATS